MRAWPRLRTSLVGGGEVAPIAGLDRQDGECGREMRFPASRVWPKNRIGSAFFDEAQGGEVRDEFLVDGGLEGEVELVDGLAGGEAREPQPGGQASVAGGGALGGDHVRQVDHRWPVLGHGLLGQGGEALGRGVETEVAEVVLELLVGRRAGGHWPRSVEVVAGQVDSVDGVVAGWGQSWWRRRLVRWRRGGS